MTTVTIPLQTIVDIYPNVSEHPQARGVLLIEQDNKVSVRITKSYHPAYAVNRIVTVSSAEVNAAPVREVRAYFMNKFGQVDMEDFTLDVNRLHNTFANDVEAYLQHELGSECTIAAHSDI